MSMDGHNTLTKRDVRVREPSKNKTNKNMKIRQNKMMGYLAVTAGVGCASSAANAAVVFYGNASNTNIQADPFGINVVFNSGNSTGNVIQSGFYPQHRILSLSPNSSYFTQGADGSRSGDGGNGQYHNSLGFRKGAQAGDQNYARVSFDGNNNVFEAVAQFYFDGAGGGYLMAIATTNAITNPQDLSLVGGPELNIAAGKAMIDAAAAIPEPSSLALLALGATGLIARRRRQQAA
jgi:hypothetical protein